MATTAEGQQRLVILGYGASTMEQGGKAQTETPPPPQQPSASPRDCVVPTSCLRCACNGGETKRAHLPPPPNPAPQRAGKADKGEATSDPPPEGNAAGRGGSGGGTNHTTVPKEGTRRASPGGGTNGRAGVG